MPASSPNTLGSESRLNAVIAGYLHAAAAGEPLEREQLLAAHPDLADGLQSFFSDHDWMAGLAQPSTADPDATMAEPGTLLPTSDDRRYVGLQPHAKGGLGEVLCATDREFNRVVALKRLRTRYAGDPDSQRRFLAEAEITARLDHPGVVPVHGMFEDSSGRPSYVMRFVDGDTLAEAIAAYHAGEPDPVAFRRLLQSFIQVCQTIGYAHSRGIIHRDLKPQNIMLGKFGETLVVDWGLSKVIGRSDEDHSIESTETLRPISVDSSGKHETQMGSAVGTPAYMSPEQAAGRWDVIGPATDIYGLGAVLYTLLTGRPPLKGDNWPELNQRIQQGDIPRPREVNPSVPHALEAICLKALFLKPSGRYHSASELASDVEHWLADEPVTAYREPITKRLGRWARRHKPVVAGGMAVAITAVISLVATSWAISLKQAEKEEADRIALIMGVNGLQNVNESRALRNALHRVQNFIDWYTDEIGQSPEFSTLEFQPQRIDLLRKSLKRWDEAIHQDEAIRPGGTHVNGYYRLHKAVCLARLGETDAALAEAGRVARGGPYRSDPASEATRGTSLPFHWVPRLLRVFAIAADHDETQREAICVAARDFIVATAEEGYFDVEPDALDRLRQDSQLNDLLSHSVIHNFLQTLNRKTPLPK